MRRSRMIWGGAVIAILLVLVAGGLIARHMLQGDVMGTVQFHCTYAPSGGPLSDPSKLQSLEISAPASSRGNWAVAGSLYIEQITVKHPSEETPNILTTIDADNGKYTVDWFNGKYSLTVYRGTCIKDM